MMLCDHTWAATKAPEHPGTSLECSPQSWNIFPSEAGKAGLLDGRVGLTCWRWEEKEEAEGSCLEARKGLQSQETWRSHGGFSSHTAVTVEKGVAGLSWCPSLPERQGGGGRAAGGLFGVGVRTPDSPSIFPSVIHSLFMPTELITKRGNYTFFLPKFSII